VHQLPDAGVSRQRRARVLAAFKEHIGLFPPIRGDARLAKAAARYAGPKGNLRFPYAEPIPYGLIERLTRLRVAQDAAKARTRRRPG